MCMCLCIVIARNPCLITVHRYTRRSTYPMSSRNMCNWVATTTQRERDRQRESTQEIFTGCSTCVCVCGGTWTAYRIYNIIRYRTTIHAHVETLVCLPVVTAENFNLPACLPVGKMLLDRSVRIRKNSNKNRNWNWKTHRNTEEKNTDNIFWETEQYVL